MSGRSRWIVVVCAAGMIFFLSSRHWGLPVSGVAAMIAAKSAHLVEYGTLGAAIAWALEPTVGRRSLFYGVALAVLYGITDEIHQSFVPGRDAGVADLIPDGIGATLGVLVLYSVRALRRLRARSLQRNEARNRELGARLGDFFTEVAIVMREPESVSPSREPAQR
ncbi:MAG: hypothetical protein NVSMB57_17010 [Actinomycetota bacterium]